MREYLFTIKVGALSLITLLSPGLAQANGEIYPAEPAAQSAINWKDSYFAVNGKPTFLTAGEMHYARIPRELWRDRIWRSKQMGFNCMQMYVFWNATEGKEGQWNFTDNLDLDAWLTLNQEMGMYGIVRVGPYSCAEWEHGGFPAWLSIKPGMTLRDTGPLFQPLADRHLAQVEKIVAKHQIHRGGNVLMVQLENEHPKGWGTDDKNPYLKHLVEQARANGLEIPLFLSGLNHGSDPSGEQPFQPGKSPWYTTEFWTGWIGKYGDMASSMLNEKVRGTWKIIAFGGAGYAYYMVHGGTNFGYSGDSFETSYDYSSPIGETGQFHNLYFPARRAAYFAQSFSSLLTSSHNDPALAKCDRPELRVTTRTNPTGGSIVLVDAFPKKCDTSKLAAIPPNADAYKSPDGEKNGVFATRVTIGGMTLPHQGSLKVVSQEPRTLIVNLPWTANASFESVCTNVLFRQTLGQTDYWVCYGADGDAGEVTLKRKVPGKSPAQVNFTYPTDATVTEIPLDSGDGHQAKLLVMNTELTEKTWLAHDKIHIGPSFVREDGSMEFPPEGGKATIYAASGKSEISKAAVPAPALPTLAAWSWRDAAAERTADFSTKDWAQSKGPQAMESYDGFQNRYGWYRTTLHRDTAGPVALNFMGKSGTFSVFLNGQPASFDRLDAKAGDNTLAVLAKIGPRPKLWNFTGPIGNGAARGLWGDVSTDSTPTITIAWKQLTGTANPAGTPEVIAQTSYDDSAWQALAGDSQKVKIDRGQTWFRGTFTVTAAQVDSILQSPSVDGKSKNLFTHENGIYLNGQRLSSPSQDVSKLLRTGKNTLLCRVSKGASANLGVAFWHNSPLIQATWYFRGGLTDLQETAIIGRVTNWNDFLTRQPWQTNTPTTPNLPTFWKNSFTYHPPTGMRETLGLVIAKPRNANTDVSTGIKAGHVWLNGHNLGECPQKVPLYMPECWLKDGENALVVFDQFGNKPDQIQIIRYEVFSIANSSLTPL